MEVLVFVVYNGLDVLLYAYEKEEDSDSTCAQFILVKEIQLETSDADHGDIVIRWISAYLSQHVDINSRVQLRIVSDCDLDCFPNLDTYSTDYSVISLSEFNEWQSCHHVDETSFSVKVHAHRSHGIIHYAPQSPVSAPQSRVSLWLDVGPDKHVEVLSKRDPLVGTSVYVPVWTGKNLLRLQFRCLQGDSYKLLGRIEFDYVEKTQLVIAINSKEENQKQLIQIKVHHVHNHWTECFSYCEGDEWLVNENGRHPVLVSDHVITEGDCTLADMECDNNDFVEIKKESNEESGEDTVSDMDTAISSSIQTVTKIDTIGESYKEDIIISRLKSHCWSTIDSGNDDQWLIGEITETGQPVKGTMLTSQGDLKFIGEWNGEGTLYHIPALPQCILTGHFVDGVVTEEATLINRWTSIVVFRGRIDDLDKGVATGTLYFSNITTYSGNLDHWKPHGEGQMYYMNGIRGYEGSFVNGYPDGKGKQFYYNECLPMVMQGSPKREEPSLLYEGEFEKGMKNGMGEMLNRQQKVVYRGKWKENKFNGDGELWLIETEGECADCVKEIISELKQDNEDYIKGEFEKGQLILGTTKRVHESLN